MLWSSGCDGSGSCILYNLTAFRSDIIVIIIIIVVVIIIIIIIIIIIKWTETYCMLWSSGLDDSIFSLQPNHLQVIIIIIIIIVTIET